MKPLHVKWAGSKKWLVKHVDFNAVLDAGSTYHELFAGGAHLFFNTAPERAVLNDVNLHLMAFYESLKKSPKDLIETLEEYQKNCRNEKAYYKIRAWKPKTTVDRGARFWYLLKMSFNGLWRENKKGDHNVGWGKRPNTNLLPPEIHTASKLLQGTSLHKLEFDDEMLWLKIKPGDLVYLDPPYVPVSKTSNFTSYNAEGFYVGHHDILIERCRMLIENGVNVVLTLGACPLVKEYKKFLHVKELEAPRKINCKAENRGVVPEYLFYNNAGILKNDDTTKPKNRRKGNARANSTRAVAIVPPGNI